MTKLAVIAVGGNSLITSDQQRSVPDQYAATVETCRHVVDLICDGWQVVLTHGNGPQVGFILRRSELARNELHEVPLDACGADTQGAIGYMFQRAICNEYESRLRNGTMPLHFTPPSPVTVITQTLVDASDPAFSDPSKPIGSFMDEQTARERAVTESWNIVEDAGRGWRRVVPSPLPSAILEIDAIRRLVQSGFLVICCGGGGIPVVRNTKGLLDGVEAVIDKDLAGALLATLLAADLFLISTAVPKVALHFGQPDQRWLDSMTTAEAQTYMEEGHFLKGSMAPKIAAVLNFLSARPAARAVITDPANILSAANGSAGTQIGSG